MITSKERVNHAGEIVEEYHPETFEILPGKPGSRCIYDGFGRIVTVCRWLEVMQESGYALQENPEWINAPFECDRFGYVAPRFLENAAR